MTIEQSRHLTADVRIPLVGFGTFPIGDDDVAPIVATALEIGYRHIDTADDDARRSSSEVLVARV